MHIPIWVWFKASYTSSRSYILHNSNDGAMICSLFAPLWGESVTGGFFSQMANDAQHWRFFVFNYNKLLERW